MREVDVKLFCLEIKLNVTQIALPLALVANPRWDAIPWVLFLTHVAGLSVLHCTGLAGSAASCCADCAARFLTRRPRSVCSEHPVSERCPGSAAAHRRDLGAAWIRAAVLWLATLELGDSG